MAALDDREAGNNLNVSVEDDHLIAGDFDFTEELESPLQNLDADTEELDISHFVGDLRALMVDDSEDEIVLDSDDEAISEQKQGKIRGRLWRHAQSVDVRSSAGSNLTDKVTDNIPSERSEERNLVSHNENETGSRDTDTRCSKGDKLVNLNASSNNFEGENAVVDESQEPGESSEADALDFVDHFLSVSAVNSSPEVKILKYDGPRSPFSSCAKGSQKLAMKTSFMTKIGVSTFDWDSDQPDHGGGFFLEKKTEPDIQRDKHLSERCKSKQLPGNDSNERDEPPDMFDVGFNTQMAAEAMEALLYATPPHIDVNEHKRVKNPTTENPSKKFSFPLSANCDSKTNGISFKQKRVANRRHKMSTSFHNKNQRELNLELLNLGKDENCTNGDNLTEPKKKVYEKSLKVYKRRKQKQDADKENLKPDNEVKTFSPVASRTRRGSCVKRSQRTADATCNGKEIDVLHKRKSGDWKFDTWKWPKKKRTCRNRRQNAKLTNTLNVQSPVVKGGNGEMEGNFKEASFMSSVKRKARSASIYRSTSGKKLSNTKCVSMRIPKTLNESEHSFESIPALGGEEKIKDLSSNGKNKTPSIMSGASRTSDQVGLPRKQLHKKSSTSSSLRNELPRLGFSESAPDFMSKDLRRRRSKVEIRVLFSQSLDDDVVKQQRKILKKLGTCMATDCSDATHFVADRFARTKKMLEAMGLGKQIVTPLWLESCDQVGCIIDEKNYILRDAKKEKQIGFSMPVSLSRATTHPLLKDRRVFITPNVEPDREMIKNLIKAVHGQVMEDIEQASMECKTSDDMLILSCEQDYVSCFPFLDKGVAVYSSELLLKGIIIQKLEYAKHQLFKGHIIMKRYAKKRKKNGSGDLDVV
ncbi:uncharacterized protein LOC111886366 isoform X1 [Lactuca sativa]|uniref:uncharacterized protein LOC111886366 isoform X1 n=1 Tax=Lactuca sativa TaxID=4236 RepID=UPI000CD7F518|nr:uncharacterized protein LOC111886366 isoform X1 [Lactuca sativa]